MKTSPYSYNDKTPLSGWVIHTLVEFIKFLEVVFTSNEKLKLLAYEKYKFCFKSVILHGVDVEKIIFLNTLKKFMSVNEIQRDVFGEISLIENLKELLLESKNSSDQMKLRLSSMIRKFLK